MPGNMGNRKCRQFKNMRHHRMTSIICRRLMPPPDGRGKAGKVASAQPMKTNASRIVRWIDLGCPIDLVYDPEHPTAHNGGWLADDNRPTLALAQPAAGKNASLDRILLGTHDYQTGVDQQSLSVVADFAVNDIPAGENLAKHFRPASPSVWELKLAEPIDQLTSGNVTVSVKDKQGNTTVVARRFSVGK